MSTKLRFVCTAAGPGTDGVLQKVSFVFSPVGHVDPGVAGTLEERGFAAGSGPVALVGDPRADSAATKPAFRVFTLEEQRVMTVQERLDYRAELAEHQRQNPKITRGELTLFIDGPQPFEVDREYDLDASLIELLPETVEGEDSTGNGDLTGVDFASDAAYEVAVAEDLDASDFAGKKGSGQGGAHNKADVEAIVAAKAVPV